MQTAAIWFLRLALAASYLSAVADRFGLWGKPGAKGVAWGEWAKFVDYVAHLNSYAPASLVPALAWGATLAEVVIALGLVVGWRLRLFAIASGVLAASFFTTMILAGGFKGPLDYSVFTVSAASFLLAAVATPAAAPAKTKARPAH
jgi:putative oxidoreductase